MSVQADPVPVPEAAAIPHRLEKLEEEMGTLHLDVQVIKTTFATKADLAEVRDALLEKMSVMNIDIKTQLIQLKEETRAEFSLLRGELDSKFSYFRSEFDGKSVQFRSEFDAKLSAFRSEFKTDIAEAKALIVIWVTTAVFLAQLVPAFVRLIERSV